MKYLLFFLACIFLFPCFSHSQNDTVSSDTARSFVFSYQLDRFEFGPGVLNLVKSDSSVFPVSQLNLGNSGLPQIFLSLRQIYWKPGFSFRRDPFDYLLFSNENQYFFRNRKPYTKLDYLAGAKKEQLFNFVHAQNISPSWNFSGRFNRIRSEGFYLRQITDITSIGLNTSYIPSNKRYHLLAGGYFNSAKAQENGGIISDSLFSTLENSDKKLVGINLTSASHLVKSKGMIIQQRLIFGGRDESGNDSIKGRISPSGTAFHEFSFNGKKITFKDENPGQSYYENFFIDSLQTNDSVAYLTLKNKIGYRSLSKRKDGTIRNFGFGAELFHESTRLFFNDSDTSLSDAGISGQIFSFPGFLRVVFYVKGRIFLVGDHSGDLESESGLSYRLNDNLQINAEGSFRKSSPYFIENRYFSNHFSWTNKFKDITETDGSVGIELKQIGFSLTGGLKKYDHFIFFRSIRKTCPIS